MNVRQKQEQVPTGNGHADANGSGRLQTVLRTGGLYYSALYGTRWFVQGMVNFLDRRLINVEQKKGLVEPWTILSGRLTAAENRKIWNEWDWSQLGEEWTKSPEWKDQIVREYLLPYVPEGQTVVEIGPGGGRWTQFIQPRAKKLTLVDVAEAPLELCRKRFATCGNLEYVLSDGRNIKVPDSSVDVVWSFDCFVHINPLDIKGYFHEFHRVLRPGGQALIHHAGRYVPGVPYRSGTRSDMTDQMALDFARECSLEVVTQTQKLLNPRDVVTVLRKPA